MGIAVEMSGDEAKLWRAYQRVIEQQKKLDGAMEKGAKVAKTTAAANDKMHSPEQLAKMDKFAHGFDDIGASAALAAAKTRGTLPVYKEAFGSRAVGAVKDYAGSFVGIGVAGAAAAAVVMLALREISAELETQAKLQKEAAKSQVTLASAHQDLRRNMGGKSDEEITTAFQKTEAISKETGVDEKYIAQAMAQGMSASGGNMEAAISAVTVAAQQLADVPDAIAGYAGSLLDLSKVSGSTDAMTNMGLLQGVGSMSRVVDPTAMAQNIPPALIGMKEFGATMQESAALFGALTVSSGDIQGAASGTAGISLTKQMDAFAKAKGFDGTIGSELEILQSNPALAEEFLKGTSDKQKKKLKGKREGEIWGGASFELKALGPIMSLLQQEDSEGAQLYRQNLGALGGESDLQGIAKDSLRQRGLVPEEGVAQMQRIGANTINQMEVGSAEAGAIGQLREQYDPLIEKSGASFWEKQLGSRENTRARWGASSDDEPTSMVKNLDMRADIMEKEGKSAEAAPIREFLAKMNEVLEKSNSTNEKLLEALKDGSKSRKARNVAE